MSAFRRRLPHISVILAIVALALCIADAANPTMGFLSSGIGRWMVALAAVSAILSGIFAVCGRQ